MAARIHPTFYVAPRYELQTDRPLAFQGASVAQQCYKRRLVIALLNTIPDVWWGVLQINANADGVHHRQQVQQLINGER